MSRVIVYGKDRQALGEFTAPVNRGWSLAGISSSSGAGSSTVAIPITAASEPWMQFGDLVFVDHPTLGPWVGVLDTPWTATPPIKITVYDAAYLFTLRSPANQVTLIGDNLDVFKGIVDLINADEDMFLRIGEASGNFTAKNREVIEQKQLWGSLNDFGLKTGTEIRLRPEIEAGRLIIYLDLSQQFGVDVDGGLFDGQNGNMRVTKALLDGDIRNKVVGISSQNSQSSRIKSEAYIDLDSVSKYGLRSTVQQFKNIDSQSLLAEAAFQFLISSSHPKLKITAEIYESAFHLLGLGNRIPVRIANLYLPGGIHGWDGIMRLIAMEFNESTNVVTVNMEAAL